MAVTAPGRATSSVEGLAAATGVDNDTLLRAYRCMLLSRKLDDK